MSMADDPITQPMKPQDTTIYLLGGLNAKMDAVIGAQGLYDTRLRTVESLVAGITAREQPKTPWYVIAGGLAGLASFITTAILLIQLVNP